MSAVGGAAIEVEEGEGGEERSGCNGGNTEAGPEKNFVNHCEGVCACMCRWEFPRSQLGVGTVRVFCSSAMRISLISTSTLKFKVELLLQA